MNRRDKLFAKIRNNPNSLSFREFETLLAQCRWVFDHQNGSHRIWYSPHSYRLPIQSKRKDAKGLEVRQFLKQYDKEMEDGKNVFNGFTVNNFIKH